MRPSSTQRARRLCRNAVENTFLHVGNLKFYWFLNSFVAFRLFRKGVKNHRFWHPFWHRFGIILASISDTFSASIFGCLFGCIFSIFGRKWSPKGRQKYQDGEDFWRPRSLQKRSKNATSIFHRFGEPFWSYFSGFGSKNQAFGSLSAPFRPSLAP